jgi:hypothetical protein
MVLASKAAANVDGLCREHLGSALEIQVSSYCTIISYNVLHVVPVLCCSHAVHAAGVLR